MKFGLYINKNKPETAKTTSTSFRNFLQKNQQRCKVCNLLIKAFKCSRYRSEKFGLVNYISTREKSGLISFLPANKEHKVSDDGKWLRDGRQEIKPARFAREFLNPRLSKKIKDNEFAVFSNAWTAETKHAERFEFSIVEPEFAYKTKTFGTQINSCMVNRHVQDFYKAFGCKVLVCKDLERNQYVGRAVLWPNVEYYPVKDGVRDTSVCHTIPWFMDRIYSGYVSGVNIYNLFCSYASDNDMYYTGSRHNGFFGLKSPDGENILCIPFKRRETPFELTENRKRLFVPYLDTFYYTNRDASIVTPVEGAFRGMEYYGRRTCGTKHKLRDPRFITENGRSEYAHSVFWNSDGFPFSMNGTHSVQGKDRKGNNVRMCTLDPEVTKFNGQYYYQKDLVTIGRKKYHVSDSSIYQKRKTKEWVLRPIKKVKAAPTVAATEELEVNLNSIENSSSTDDLFIARLAQMFANYA